MKSLTHSQPPDIRTSSGWDTTGLEALLGGYRQWLVIWPLKGRDCSLCSAGGIQEQLPSLWFSVLLLPLYSMSLHSRLWHFSLESMYWDTPGSATSFLQCLWISSEGFLQELIACFESWTAHKLQMEPAFLSLFSTRFCGFAFHYVIGFSVFELRGSSPG